MNLREFLTLLDELCPIPAGIEALPLHELQVSYTLCDPEPSRIVE